MFEVVFVFLKCSQTTMKDYKFPSLSLFLLCINGLTLWPVKSNRTAETMTYSNERHSHYLINSWISLIVVQPMQWACFAKMSDARQSLIVGAQSVGERKVFHQMYKVKTAKKKKKPFSELDTTLTHSSVPSTTLLLSLFEMFIFSCIHSLFLSQTIFSNVRHFVSTICNKLGKKLCAASFLNMTHYLITVEIIYI